jgi:hypothetical protein
MCGVTAGPSRGWGNGRGRYGDFASTEVGRSDDCRAVFCPGRDRAPSGVYTWPASRRGMAGRQRSSYEWRKAGSPRAYFAGGDVEGEGVTRGPVFTPLRQRREPCPRTGTMSACRAGYRSSMRAVAVAASRVPSL